MYCYTYIIDLLSALIIYNITVKILKLFNDINITKTHISFAIGYGLFYFIGLSINNGYNSFYLAFLSMIALCVVFLVYYTHIKLFQWIIVLISCPYVTTFLLQLFQVDLTTILPEIILNQNILSFPYLSMNYYIFWFLLLIQLFY